MIYPKNFENKIEFDQIRLKLADSCLSEQGKRYAEKIRFVSDFDQLKKLLDQTEEFRQLILVQPNFPSQDYFDLTDELNRIQIQGSYIELEKLFDLKSSLSTMLDIVTYFNTQHATNFYNIKSLADRIIIDKSIPKKIEQLIDDKGEIQDNASSKLAEIRKKIKSKLGAVDRKINQTLKAAKQAGWVASDAEVTIRDGRPVIPMPATHKRKIKGFVLDESATGQTVYLEPGEVLELNNEIRELYNAERREIIQILKDFSDFIRPHIPDLTEGYRTVGLIDFIRAKAKFAIAIRAVKPKLHDKTLINWQRATHPLLFLHHEKLGKKVIPLNIHLNTDQRILVISGPNAGGKSVCLKTVALIQYMLQCGLLIPVQPDSEAGIFTNMFIDIGDEQSLENDLSTYSSHLLNMKNFVLNSDERSIFFIDEFGTGTEPQLGGAIAEAILENLNQKNVFGVITTHYANLKVLAREGNGIINGAMLFDAEKIEPLYELKIGQPGSSFAFEIAKKIGFPKKILKLAEEKTGSQQLDFEQQLQQLDLKKREIQKKEEELRLADSFLSEMIDKYEKLSGDLETSKTEIIAKARKEALEVIESSNKLIEKTIKDIRESQADKSKTKELRKKIEEQAEVIKSKTKAEKPTKLKKQVQIKKRETSVKTEAIKVGDFVSLPEQNISGEVVLIKDDEVVIVFNSITFKTQLSKVQKTTGQKIKAAKRLSSRYSSVTNDMNDKLANFKLKLDVRGKRGDEAIELVRQYIDDAILLNIREVSILHGKGFGILRNIIHDYLRSVPEIRQFKDEHVERGGHGITLVILK
ncbi:MAG TPA: Smr/MutS family protein [Bacteroidales bacterium]|nr:Smr/MutS family protein [Bacteroidales bacterium]